MLHDERAISYICIKSTFCDLSFLRGYYPFSFLSLPKFIFNITREETDKPSNQQIKLTTNQQPTAQPDSQTSQPAKRSTKNAHKQLSFSTKHDILLCSCRKDRSKEASLCKINTRSMLFPGSNDLLQTFKTQNIVV